MENSIKIFVTYKDKHKIIETDIIKPIQTGRAIAAEAFEGMIGDDTGENISEKNPKYSEISAQYWVWKNYDKIGNPDYVGFMHYRRHFIFNDEHLSPNIIGCVEFENFNEDYVRKISLNDKDIANFVSGNDIIVCSKIMLRKIEFLKNKKDLTRNAYTENCHLQSADYDLMLETVVKFFPEYRSVINKLPDLEYNHWYNMFVMKKEIFFEYNNFLFTILSELEKQIDMSLYCNDAIRTLGYLSERLLTIFIEKKREEKKCKIKETPITFLKNVEEISHVKCDSNTINIVMSSSDFYTPYLSTALESLKEHLNCAYKYKVYILTRDISKRNKNILLENYTTENLSLEFINMNFFNYNFKVLPHITIETYFRMLIPQLFTSENNLIFIDSDTLILSDLVELHKMTLDKPIAAAKDYIMQCLVTSKKQSKYLKEKLKIKNLFDYFNAGIMVYNLNLFTKEKGDKIKDLLLKNNYEFLDQDPFNIVFEDDYKELDFKWNYTPMVEYEEFKKYIPHFSTEEVKKAEESPEIIHYNGILKPWSNPEKEKSEHWWIYARKTPFYEEILKRMAMSAIPMPPPPRKHASNQRLRQILEIQNLAKLRFQRNPHKILSQKTYLQSQNQRTKIVNLSPYILRDLILDTA